MSMSVRIVLGNATDEVKKAVKFANDGLREKLAAIKRGQVAKKSGSRLRSVLRSSSVQIGSYLYMPGGHWKPINCRPRWKVAIIIPFRDRYHHLPIILRYLTPMLKRQLLEFTFFAVEQANRDLFNRAMLMNVGFLEALNFTRYDCFIFHDVDHIPHDDRNYYGCTGMPRHFLSGVDRWNYKLMYEDFFGAVTGLTRDQIVQINGFPNVYWGWGGEDDEIRMRVEEAHLNITRAKGPIAFYDVIHHHHNRAPPALDRFSLLETFRTRYRGDGLNNIVYPEPTYTFNLLYTNVSVDIKRIYPSGVEMRSTAVTKLRDRQ
ncbi:beta-1,4-galactosyltransferase 6-like [Diadema setosum]|uniref:beta-1,4-galactosyltransferase 6-like n=1 Tax=Diadema setosum TaxID=31175 RepID=UPI003B3A1816